MRREKAHRVRIKGGDDGGLSRSLGLADSLTRDCLVAEVKTIEIAERDDGSAQGIGHNIAGGKAGYAHAAGGAFAIGFNPSRRTRMALPPITARISSGVKPSSSSACVTCTSFDVSKRTVVAPS